MPAMEQEGTKKPLTPKERREEAIKKHQAALKQLRRQDAEARAKDLERERAAESRLKTCLGGAVLAAIREGRLDQAQIVAAISPGLREQDRAVLAPLL